MSSSDASDLVEVPDVLNFPDGLVGLPRLHSFTLSPVEGTTLFELTTEDDAGFTFVAAHAEDVRAGMTADLVERGLAPRGSVLLVLLSVHGDPPSPTANLAGPIVIDPAAAIADQIVLEDPRYPLRAPLGEA